MSNNTAPTAPTAPAAHEKKSGGFWLNVAVIVAIFAIFAIILVIAYLPQRGADLSKSTTSELTTEQRATMLADMRAKEKSAATTYGWVDQPKGIVRLPLDRAVELTIRELNAKHGAVNPKSQ